MDIRQLQYLVALAREKHFTRAAQACHVTQPTLSGRIRQLEQELGVPIVERGQRFVGFTPEGERVLQVGARDSRQLDVAAAGNRHAAEHVHAARRSALGRRHPSALPMAGLDTKAIQERHPRVELVVLSQSSIDILRHLEDFSIDVGLTYLDNEPIEACASRPSTWSATACWSAPTIRWPPRRPFVGRGGQAPLCLLTPDKQNRRIIDRAFRAASARPIPRLETNSVINLCSNVHLMGLPSIIPELLSECSARFPTFGPCRSSTRS